MVSSDHVCSVKCDEIHLWIRRRTRPAFNDCEMHFGVGHGRWSNGERVLVDNDEVREFPCFQPTELIINPTDKRRVPCVEVKGVRN